MKSLTNANNLTLYHKAIQNRIKYYAVKYDPQGLYQQYNLPELPENEPEKPVAHSRLFQLMNILFNNIL
jgi:hypothetical protein